MRLDRVVARFNFGGGTFCEVGLVGEMQKCIILAYFTQNLTTPALIFRTSGRTTQIVGNFLENLNFLIKIQ